MSQAAPLRSTPCAARWRIRAAIALATVLFSIGTTLPAEAQPARLTSLNPNSRINVRSAPSTTAPAPNYGLAGDRVEVISQTRGSDGYTWYRVQFASGAQGWVRGDFISLLPGNPPATSTPTPITVRPTPIATPTPVVTPTPTVPPVINSPAATHYTTDQINYFLEIAMGSEFGSTDGAIRKWNGPIRIRVIGTPTAEDLRSLRTVISDINSLAQGISLSIDSNNPNIDIVFAPESQFSRYEPNYEPTNMGFFWTWWNRDTLNRARVLISTVGVTQQERSHLIREELTQSLGLMQDSYRYPDSIFYQGWTDPTQYAPIDRALIAMLYSPQVRPGMTRSQVTQVLRNLTVPTAVSAPSVVTSDRPLDFSLSRP